MPTPRLRIGQLLVDAKLITAAALEEALLAQRTDNRRLGTLLVERGLVNETQLTQILSHQLSVPWVSLLHIEFSRQLLNLVPHDVADRFCLVPIYVRHVRNQGDTLYVAMDDPSNEVGLAACREHSGLPVRAMIAPPADIRNAIRVYYGVEPRAATLPAPTSEPASTMREPKVAAVEASAEPAAAVEPEVETRRDAPTEAAVEPKVPAPVQASVEPEVPAPVQASVEPEVPAPAEAPAEPEVRAEPAAPAEPAPSEAPAEPEIREQPEAPPEVEGPEIEATEIPIDRARAERLREVLEQPEAPHPSEPPVADIPRPRGRAPKMVSLTLLDGTTINLPAKRRARSRPAGDESTAASPDRPIAMGGDPPYPPAQPVAASPAPALTSEPPGPDAVQGLTARDLVLALRVVAHGADASEVLGSNVRWESLFAALLSLMLKKHLIADWEFVDELKKNL